jgi:general secretion pathway protein K
MGLMQAFREKHQTLIGGQSSAKSGIALMMVIAAMAVLSILVTEFVYIAQMNQAIAFDGLDQLKAHYLAKSGLKISLLRLKAYIQVKNLANTIGGGAPGGTAAKPATGGSAAPAIPKSILDKIWSFPFFYPIPTNIPGLSLGDKDKIEKFQKDSSLEGSFSAQIDSESSKYNLNMILPQFAPSPNPSSGASPNPTPIQTGSAPPQTAGGATGTFSADDARQSLNDYLTQLMANKAEDDEEFAAEYRGFRMDDLMDNIVGWADRSYEKKNRGSLDDPPSKQAPFYSITELHMIPLIDDRLYDLFTPNLTASATQGIDVNSMQDTTLRALVPQMTKEEITDFFKFRDDPDQDNTFKSSDDFFKYLGSKVAAFAGTGGNLDKLKKDLSKRNIQILTDESLFKITVQAHMNQAVRTIEAYVTLTGVGTPSPTASGTPGKTTTPPPAAAPPLSGPGPGGAPAQVDPGLRITFLRIE